MSLAAPAERQERLSTLQLVQYGAFGLPLALVALPIYVYVAKFYSDRFGLSLALIGSLLLATRLFDTVTDLLLGWWVDRGRHGLALEGSRQGVGTRSSGTRFAGYRRFIVYALPLLGVGYVALFQPLIGPGTAQNLQLLPALWLAAALIVVYLGYSLATIAYQAWGAELAVDPVERTRITGVREGLGLVGVIVAAVLPEQFGMSALTVTFVVVLLASSVLLIGLAPHPLAQRAPDRTTSNSAFDPAFDAVFDPAANAPATSISASLRIPLGNAAFRVLLWIFLVNGIASAIPANLILFYVRDVLQLPSSGLFLGAYFIAGAASIPVWIALAKRIGQARSWLCGMLASIAAFVWAYGLGAGDQIGFLTISIVSGLALGADLALPAAMLASVINAAGHRGTREGAYFGLWSFATKLNLALAAGISLPLLSWLGYVPQSTDAEGALQGAHALSIAYAIVPCVLKLLAAGLLWRSSFFKEKV